MFATVSGDGLTTPPIGQSYAQWMVFVFVIILSVMLADWLLLLTIGRKR